MAQKHRDIGIIGKAVLTEGERRDLRFIGRCIARLGHRLILVPAPGTTSALREGTESEDGETVSLDKGVIEASDQTLIYPDQRLLERLRASYPDLESRSDVVVIHDHQLGEWVAAITEILEERGIPLPPR